MSDMPEVKSDRYEIGNDYTVENAIAWLRSVDDGSDLMQSSLAIQTIEKALLTANKPNVPKGWKLVPIEPTEAMMEAGDSTGETIFDDEGAYRETLYYPDYIYKAMISAAPETK